MGLEIIFKLVLINYYMKRLTKYQITLINNFSTNGLSLRKIMEKLNLPLSTVQYHTSKKDSRKRKKSICLPKSEFTRGELIGAFSGDGSYYHDNTLRGGKHRVYYHLSYKEDIIYSEYLSKILNKMGLCVNSFVENNDDGKPSCLKI